MSICFRSQRPAPFRLSKLPEFSNNRGKLAISLHFQGVSASRRSFSPFLAKGPPSRELGLLAAASAASSAPLDGSSVELHDSHTNHATTGQSNDSKAGMGQEEEIEDPILLADADSCFCEFSGVKIHHKICHGDLSISSKGSTLESSKRVNFPIILLHGFGASVFSWNKVMKPLAQMCGSKVLAFDRPAFGLTSRVNAINHLSSGTQDSRPLNPFSMIFSVLASFFFIDLLAADKAILVGHSAGALVAVDAYFMEPERIAALILVAPAIFAPLIQNVRKESPGALKDGLVSHPKENRFSRLLGALSKVLKRIAAAVGSIIRGIKNMINSLYRNVLASVLRSPLGVMLMRMLILKFGTQAVRTAWYDQKQVRDHVLEGYTKPLKMKFWDKALAEYAVAMLADPASESKLPLGKKLSEISCPVLIVSGDTDRLVPLWNSRRLSESIPGCCFQVIKNCGHLPQEEKPQEFVSIVDEFLHQVFGNSQPSSQVPAT